VTATVPARGVESANPVVPASVVSSRPSVWPYLIILEVAHSVDIPDIQNKRKEKELAGM
jgi:hypothetical protein